MFDTFQTLLYKDRPLPDYRYYVMGQICIDAAQRGTGLFQQLYEAHRHFYAPRFDLCLTEVSSSNARSMRAHEKVGFQTIHRFSDETDEWNILLWDWQGG
jgi:L-amino acid N-acyltransferase YncA